MKKRYLFLLFIILISSCKIMDDIYLKSEIRKAMLSGKVISEEGLPLEGVTVKLNKINETKTDINGRFLYNYIRFGKYDMTFEKDGYSKAEFSFEYKFKNRKKTPVIKIKMFSLNFLVSEGFEYLKEKDYEKVEEMLGRLDTIDPDSEIVLYLKGIYFYTKEQYEEARMILESLKIKDRKNVYYQLTLIEIYEKLEMYDNMAKLCYYVGINNMENYKEYLKKASVIYNEKLDNSEEAEKIKKEYNKYINEANKK